MSGQDHSDIQSHVRIYMLVFGALAILTVITVGASYLEVTSGESIFIALIIASVKGSLVASYFMHLISERTMIINILLLTVAFFFVLMFIPLMTTIDASQILQ